MSVQDNLLNEKNIVLEQPETETEKNNQMCSFNSDEMEDMCYFRQDEACGDGLFAKQKMNYLLKQPKMIRKTSNNKSAVIILHEIYGINSFIEEICTDYKMQGFDVFCPDMIQRERFLYSEAAEAYQYFFSNNGFEYYKEIEDLISNLKLTYVKVFIIGFSVGATVAWRCCEHPNCDGIICCYGSRIREYVSLQPSNPVLLLFAKHDSFNVEIVAEQLGAKPNLDLHILQAIHGFMDHYSNCFNKEQSQIAKMCIRQFINRLL